jgi:hypothetical protein
MSSIWVIEEITGRINLGDDYGYMFVTHPGTYPTEAAATKALNAWHESEQKAGRTVQERTRYRVAEYRRVKEP